MGAGLKLEPVSGLQRIRGVPFAAGVRYRQIVVTGPPGSGKSTLVQRIGGWPTEGYVDLGADRWWRMRCLVYRPREIHLGLPFPGFKHSLALFDGEFLAAPPQLDPEWNRVHLPPHKGPSGLVDWRRKFVFEFLLPEGVAVLEARRRRSGRRTHPVDLELSLEKIEHQLRLHAEVARLLHRNGFHVFVRDAFGSPPQALDEPRRHDPSPLGRKKRPFIESLARRLLAGGGDRVVDDLAAISPLALRGEKVRIPLDSLPVEITVGPQVLEAHVERPVRPSTPWPRSLLLFDPEARREGIGGFVRLGEDQRIRIGKGEEDRVISTRLPPNALPRLEIAHEGPYLSLMDLDSPTGTSVEALPEIAEDHLPRDRVSRLAALRERVGPVEALDPGPALDLLRQVNRLPWPADLRPTAFDGLPGGWIDLPPEQTPLIIGDLHANVDNLLRILCENQVLEGLERAHAALILLGDAVHREEDSAFEEMESSVVTMDLVLRLMLAFPGRCIYLRGNHDSFSHDVTKEGVAQGQLWRSLLLERRGATYIGEMERFYERLPYVVSAHDFIACHAGPPLGSVSRRKLIDIRRHPKLMHQLTWNRLKRPGKPDGYAKRDVAALRKALGLPRTSALVVSHNPLSEERTWWTDVGGIKGHHLVYSARPESFAIMTRLGGEIVPLEFLGEALAFESA